MAIHDGPLQKNYFSGKIGAFKELHIMRRSICYTEPATILAGEKNTWKFIYTPSTNLPKGTLLKFDIGSKGRAIDWETPDVNLKKGSNIIYALLPNAKVISAEEAETPKSFVPQFLFRLPQEVHAGASLTIVMGAPVGQNAQKNGNTAQLTIQRRRPFLLYVDTSGKGNFHDPEMFTIDIKGNTLHSIKVLAPSFAIKNKRFDVVLRFEDKYGNLTNNAPEKTLIELSHENLRDNLKWKLFIPETGFIALPNLYFNEPGVYTIQLKNVTSGEVFYSSPIKCFATDTKQLFWGLLHGESERFDSTESLDSCMRHFRDEKSLNFYATSSFESIEETSNELWKQVQQTTEELDEDERFSVFLGFQWVGEKGSEGVRQIVYAKDQKPILRKKEQRNSSLKKMYKAASAKEFISIPSMTLAKGFEYDFKDFNQDFERVVEIYNAWGSSEQTKEEGNARPISCAGKKGIGESKEGQIIKALLANCRFGFVAGGLDDRGIFADFYEGDQNQYTPGLTGCFAEQLTKTALFEALYNRNCYATTGERMIMGLFLAGLPMGSETDTQKKPGLHINRHLTGFVAGTTKLKQIELIRNGKVLTKFTPNSHEFEFEFDDSDYLLDVSIDADDKKPPFVFYYLRATQNDGHMAWSSPIWVDCFPSKGITKNVKKDKIAKTESTNKEETEAQKGPTKKETTKKESPKKETVKKETVKKTKK
jgi:hypothetical protein